MPQINQIDREHQFKEIVVQSPYGLEVLNDTTFESAEKVAEKCLNQIISSHFYKTVNVHFGLKSKSQLNYLSEIYKRKHNILQYSIQAEQRLLENLKKAGTEEEVNQVQKLYDADIQIIKQRIDEVDHTDFIPYIYIDAEKKWPVYGQVMQDFNRKGMGMLQAKLGYRSVFKMFDKIQFNYQSPITDVKRKYYQTGFTWQNPTQDYGDFYFGVNYANNNIYKDIDQSSKVFSVGINNQKFRLELQRNARQPSVFGSYMSNYIMKNYHVPSTKYSAKLTAKLKKNLTTGDIVTGQYSQLTSEVSLPPFSQAKFMKLQYNHRKYFDPFFFSQYFSPSSKLRKFIANSSIEGNFTASLLANRKDYVSDLLQNIDVRGFQQSRNPTPSYGNVKSSLKLNVYNYPVLGSIKVVPFLYAQAGLSLLKDLSHSQNILEARQIRKMQVYPSILASSGIGLAYYVAPYTQLQLVYSLFQYQTRKSRQPVNFQIRIGVFD